MPILEKKKGLKSMTPAPILTNQDKDKSGNQFFFKPRKKIEKINESLLSTFDTRSVIYGRKSC